MKWSLVCAGALSAVALLVACSGDEGAPGPGGTGSSSSSSSSSGSTTSSSSSGDAGGSGSTLLTTGTVGCEKDSDCASNVCFLGNMQHFCTLKCTTANATSICEAPLTGTCNKQGYCKRD